MRRASFFWWSFGVTRTNKCKDEYKNEFWEPDCSSKGPWVLLRGLEFCVAGNFPVWAFRVSPLLLETPAGFVPEQAAQPFASAFEYQRLWDWNFVWKSRQESSVSVGLNNGQAFLHGAKRKQTAVGRLLHHHGQTRRGAQPDQPVPSNFQDAVDCGFQSMEIAQIFLRSFEMVEAGGVQTSCLAGSMQVAVPRKKF